MNGSVADQSTVTVKAPGSAAGKVIWRFVDNVDFPLSWNPAGTKIAIGLSASADRGGTVYSSPTAGLWVVSTNGSARRLVSGDIGPVAWNPTGNTIAFMPLSLTSLQVVPAGGGIPKLVAQLPLDTGLYSYADPTLSWSPDGSEIAVAFEESRPPGRVSSSQVTLYPTAAGGTPRTILGPSTQTIFTGATFSPDGSKLAVTVLSPPSTEVPASGRISPTTPATADQSSWTQSLDLVNVNGTNLHVITNFDSAPLMIGWFQTP